jgi:tRNA(fMet)-specific endonuclease VapC
VGDRLILDSGILVRAERGQLDLSAIVDPEDDVVVPAICVAEYLAGVHLADTDARKATRRAFLDRVLTAVPVEDYTPTVAEHHAVLLAQTHRERRKRGARDLIIAATARATRRVIITTDGRARFGELPAVAVRLVSQD